jgi:uncharacterized protein YndB with AHSA1/START domain
MRLETSIDIDAAPETVWAVLTDVEQWPAWTRSVTTVQRLDDGAFGVGSRARIRQPRLRTMTWQVTGLVPGQEFSWSSRAAGLHTVAGHQIVPRDGGVTVRLTIDQSGPLAPVIGRLAAAATRSYLEMEAQGLKRRSEGG